MSDLHIAGDEPPVGQLLDAAEGVVVLDADRLLGALAAATPLSPRRLFVLLWTFLAGARLNDAEAYFRQQRVNTRHVPAHDPDAFNANGIKACVESLIERRADPLAFAAFALSVLKGLDVRLGHGTPIGAWDDRHDPVEGLDGNCYRVRARNPVIARALDRGGALTSAADQAPSLLRHVGQVVAVPVDVNAFEISCCSPDRWLPWPWLRLRIQTLDRFRVILWPSAGVEIDYDPALTTYRGPGRAAEAFALTTISNEAAVEHEIRSAIAAARDREATLLIIPELACSERLESTIEAVLRQNGRSGYPILTLLGLTHRRCEVAGLYKNEARLLGPDGTELHRHRKLTVYGFRSHQALDAADIAGDPSFAEEKTFPGKHLHILESRLGNLACAICLDLFQNLSKAVLFASHANVIAVPSLSLKLDPHRTAAKELMNGNLAATFVSNRAPWPVADPGETASFCRVPASGEFQPTLVGGRFLEFDVPLAAT